MHTIQFQGLFETNTLILQDTPVSVRPAAIADDAQTIGHDVEMLANDMRSLAEHCSCRMSCHLPACYRDILPQPPPVKSGSSPGQSPDEFRIKGARTGERMLAWAGNNSGSTGDRLGTTTEVKH